MFPTSVGANPMQSLYTFAKILLRTAPEGHGRARPDGIRRTPNGPADARARASSRSGPDGLRRSQGPISPDPSRRPGGIAAPKGPRGKTGRMSEVGPGVGSSDDAGPASRPIPHPQFRTGRSGFALGLALSSDGVSWSNRSTSSRRASTISASVTRRMATATSDPAYFITLIHGTWATGAVWTREGSALRRPPVRSVGPVESIALVPVVRSQYSRGAAPGRGGVEGLHPRLSREAPRIPGTISSPTAMGGTSPCTGCGTSRRIASSLSTWIAGGGAR